MAKVKALVKKNPKKSVVKKIKRIRTRRSKDTAYTGGRHSGLVIIAFSIGLLILLSRIKVAGASTGIYLEPSKEYYLKYKGPEASLTSILGDAYNSIDTIGIWNGEYYSSVEDPAHAIVEKKSEFRIMVLAPCTVYGFQESSRLI